MLETEKKVRPRLRAADVTTFYKDGTAPAEYKVLKHRGLVGKFINISNKQASLGKLIVSVKSVQVLGRTQDDRVARCSRQSRESEVKSR
jgi:hypothetical protein